ncbi:MAG TPA: hypothetical protein VHG51_10825 [Longimicrobiaceae bacterium]|nr:hypothetical protein [Longimicrobiaceae bacterium]
MIKVRALLAAAAVALLAACSQSPTAPLFGDTADRGGSSTIGSGL